MSKNDRASFTWTINNYSYCWQKTGEPILSPTFSIYMPVETKWKILLFPRGVASYDEFVSLYLYRDNDCEGAEKIEVEYSLHIPTATGPPVQLKKLFRKNQEHGFSNFINRNQTKEAKKLTVRCEMIRIRSETVKLQEIVARTIIGVEKCLLQCHIENFSYLAPDHTQSFAIKSESEGIKLQINLVLNGVENICFGIDSFEQGIKFSAVKTFIIDYEKQEVDSGEYEYWFNSGKCNLLTLKLTKRKLIENKNLYLPNDVLTLSFKLALSTGFAFEGIETATCEWTLCTFPDEIIENCRNCINHKTITACPCTLITDLASLQEDQSTCDMKLQTKTNMFPVHTLILSARSPVFKAMFSTNMKEKNNGCVDVSDLHDDTVRRFLLYLYSDQLEDLNWEDAMRLYKAADKYAVISLRDKCSVFLKSNLNKGNTCEALMLSDLHQDKDLKVLTQSFILKNAKVIFKSEEWKLLAEANAKLALETTLRNWNDDRLKLQSVMG